MGSQKYQTIYSLVPISKIFHRIFRRIKLLFRRYTEWHQLKRNHEELLRMEDRMLKDIGLSRSDVDRIMRNHKFWRHMFQSEESDKGIEPMRKAGSIVKFNPTKDHASSDFCLCSADRSFSKK